HLSPLIPILQQSNRLFIATVSMRRLRLFSASEYSISEIQIEDEYGLADEGVSMSEALRLDEVNDEQMLRSGRAGGINVRASGMTNQFGMAGATEIQKKTLLAQYMRRVDDVLMRYLSGETYPLLFMGVGYLFPIFREACS